MTTGQRIREARKKAGLTQAQLAEKLGIPFQSISQWERDIRHPKRETMERIADALGVIYLTLYGDEDYKEIDSFIKDGVKIGATSVKALSRMEVLSEYRDKGYEFSPSEARLVNAFNRKLNTNAKILLLQIIDAMEHDKRALWHNVDPVDTDATTGESDSDE